MSEDQILAWKIAYNFLLEGPNVTFVRRIIGQSEATEKIMETVHRGAEDILLKLADELGDPYE